MLQWQNSLCVCGISTESCVINKVCLTAFRIPLKSPWLVLNQSHLCYLSDRKYAILMSLRQGSPAYFFQKLNWQNQCGQDRLYNVTSVFQTGTKSLMFKFDLIKILTGWILLVTVLWDLFTSPLALWRATLLVAPELSVGDPCFKVLSLNGTPIEQAAQYKYHVIWPGDELFKDKKFNWESSQDQVLLFSM